ncbi:MAG: hypothetical protein WAQ33_05120 [Gaiellaceae bacterium]
MRLPRLFGRGPNGIFTPPEYLPPGSDVRALRATWVATIGAALLLAGCGGGGDHASSGCQPLVGAGTAARTGPHPTQTMLLTDVRIGSHNCVDRVEFAFRKTEPGPPGVRVAYMPADQALVEDGSGAPITIDGTAYLVVRFEPAATADLSGEQLVPTYTGPRRLPAADAKFVREIVKSGDFEAVLTWVIGVSEQRPFKTTVSDSGLVVEIG